MLGVCRVLGEVTPAAAASLRQKEPALWKFFRQSCNFKCLRQSSHVSHVGDSSSRLSAQSNKLLLQSVASVECETALTGRQYHGPVCHGNGPPWTVTEFPNVRLAPISSLMYADSRQKDRSPGQLRMSGSQWRNQNAYTFGKWTKGRVTTIGHSMGRVCFAGDSWVTLKRTYAILSRNSFKSCHYSNMCTHDKGKVESSEECETTAEKMTTKEKFKKAVKEYGAVFIVFHVAISLVSLGCCYLVLASGIAETHLFKYCGLDENTSTAETAATFIVAYAVHKTLAPWRLGLSLTVSPILVNRLRKLGYLKPPK